MRTQCKSKASSHEGRRSDLHGTIQDDFIHFLIRFGLAVAVNVFHFHGCVVHKDADSERQPSERHDVDGLADYAQHDK